MKKSKPLPIYLTDDEKQRLGIIKEALGQNTLSSTVKTLMRIFFKFSLNHDHTTNH